MPAGNDPHKDRFERAPHLQTTGISESATTPLPVMGKQFDEWSNSVEMRSLATLLTETTKHTTQRTPLVIKSSMKKPPVPPRRPHTGRRVVVTLVGVFMLLLITGATLLSVTPLGHDLSLNFNPLLTSNNLVKSTNNNPSNLISQATATAVINQQTDGYDPSAGSGGQNFTNGSGSLNWPTGQCTDWANQRYHALTTFWVSWSGNAWQWVAGAQGAGWNVSQTPHYPSIIVLMPYTQGAYGYGHVAVVEKIINNTTVNTSNFNFYANGGSWDIESDYTFTTGAGVYFIWHK